MVLLKNDNQTLPLDLSRKGKHYLVLGHDSGVPKNDNHTLWYSLNQAIQPFTGGGGSSYVKPSYKRSPLDEMAVRLNIEAFQNCSISNKSQEYGTNNAGMFSNSQTASES